MINRREFVAGAGVALAGSLAGNPIRELPSQGRAESILVIDQIVQVAVRSAGGVGPAIINDINVETRVVLAKGAAPQTIIGKAVLVTTAGGRNTARLQLSGAILVGGAREGQPAGHAAGQRNADGPW